MFWATTSASTLATGVRGMDEAMTSPAANTAGFEVLCRKELTATPPFSVPTFPAARSRLSRAEMRPAVLKTASASMVSAPSLPALRTRPSASRTTECGGQSR